MGLFHLHIPRRIYYTEYSANIISRKSFLFYFLKECAKNNINPLVLCTNSDVHEHSCTINVKSTPVYTTTTPTTTLSFLVFPSEPYKLHFFILCTQFSFSLITFWPCTWNETNAFANEIPDIYRTAINLKMPLWVTNKVFCNLTFSATDTMSG
jgi:hypothetical protein